MMMGISRSAKAFGGRKTVVRDTSAETQYNSLAGRDTHSDATRFSVETLASVR